MEGLTLAQYAARVPGLYQVRRKGGQTTGTRSKMSGLPGRVANLVFNMYAGRRHVKAHGAVARPRRGNHGLAAACAFVKDLLKTFLAEPLQQCRMGKPRDCVGDITL